MRRSPARAGAIALLLATASVGCSRRAPPSPAPHDWVLAGPGLDALEEPVAIGAASFASGLVFDSRVYTPLSDVPPVLATDSGASGMQHMAVVRDFALGGGG